MRTKKFIWRRDKPFLAGFILVFLSFVLGIYGKIFSIIKFNQPVYLLMGLSIWAFSWILLMLGVFLVGWETVKMIQTSVHNKMKETVKDTYRYTKHKYKKLRTLKKSILRKN